MFTDVLLGFLRRVFSGRSDIAGLGISWSGLVFSRHTKSPDFFVIRFGQVVILAIATSVNFIVPNVSLPKLLTFAAKHQIHLGESLQSGHPVPRPGPPRQTKA